MNGFPIADLRLPIDFTCDRDRHIKIGNWQLAIGNRKYE
jgi:hypothetical protein